MLLISMILSHNVLLSHDKLPRIHFAQVTYCEKSNTLCDCISSGDPEESPWAVMLNCTPVPDGNMVSRVMVSLVTTSVL